MGKWNVLNVGDNFNPDSEEKKGFDFVEKFGDTMRTPPCTPAQFSEELRKREIRAKMKGVALFTSGKDQPFVLEKYHQAFAELLHAESFKYAYMNWGDAEIAHFAEVLAQCEELKVARP